MCNNTSLTDISLFHTSPVDLFHFSTKPSQVSALCLGNFVNIDPVILQYHLSILILKHLKSFKLNYLFAFLDPGSSVLRWYYLLTHSMVQSPS